MGQHNRFKSGKNAGQCKKLCAQCKVEREAAMALGNAYCKPAPLVPEGHGEGKGKEKASLPRSRYGGEEGGTSDEDSGEDFGGQLEDGAGYGEGEGEGSETDDEEPYASAPPMSGHMSGALPSPGHTPVSASMRAALSSQTFQAMAGVPKGMTWSAEERRWVYGQDPGGAHLGIGMHHGGLIDM